MSRAVFLDRDGVLTQNVWYADTISWEAPRTVADFKLIPRAIDAAKRLQDLGYLLILVSNQPNQAKNKATLHDHELIHAKLVRSLQSVHVNLAETYYCFHHPEGINPEFGRICECRKPSPNSLFAAGSRFGIDFSASWMIGDRITDVECGSRAGVSTIQIIGNDVAESDRSAQPDFRAADLWGAVDIIERT